MDRRIAALAAAIILSGCITPAKHRRGIDEALRKGYEKGFVTADGECMELQVKLKEAFEQLTKDKTALLTELALKNERLETFNQLDEQGNLRVAKKEKPKSPKKK